MGFTCTLRWLTHCGRVAHIFVNKLAIIGSDNGSSPGRCEVIIWTNAEILLNQSLETNFSEIWSKIQTFSFKKMLLKTSSAKWRPSCLGLSVLRIDIYGLNNYTHLPLSSSVRAFSQIITISLKFVMCHKHKLVANEMAMISRKKYSYPIAKILIFWLILAFIHITGIFRSSRSSQVAPLAVVVTCEVLQR